MQLRRTQQKKSSRRYPQTDSASIIINCMVENYLRCYCSYHQEDWDLRLPTTEFLFNISVSKDLGSSPFKLDLRWTPKTLLDSISETDVPVQSVENFKLKLESLLEDVYFLYKFSKAPQASEAAS